MRPLHDAHQGRRTQGEDRSFHVLRDLRHAEKGETMTNRQTAQIFMWVFFFAAQVFALVILHQDRTIQQQRVLIRKMYKDCPLEKP